MATMSRSSMMVTVLIGRLNTVPSVRIEFVVRVTAAMTPMARTPLTPPCRGRCGRCRANAHAKLGQFEERM